MLAANIWHWWIGLALVLLAIASIVVMIGAYLRYVSAKKHPTRAQRSHHHTDL